MKFPEFAHTYSQAKKHIRVKRYIKAYTTLQKFIQLQKHHTLAEGIKVYSLLLCVVNKILKRQLKKREIVNETVLDMADKADSYYVVLYSYLELYLNKQQKQVNPCDISGLTNESHSLSTRQREQNITARKYNYSKIPQQKHYSKLEQLNPEILLERVLLPTGQVHLQSYIDYYFQNLISFLVCYAQLYAHQGKPRLAYCYFFQAHRLGQQCFHRNSLSLLSEISNAELSLAAFLSQLGSLKNAHHLYNSNYHAEQAIEVGCHEVILRQQKGIHTSKEMRVMRRTQKRMAFGCLLLMLNSEELMRFEQAYEMANLGIWFSKEFIPNESIKKNIIQDCDQVIKKYETYIRQYFQLSLICEQYFGPSPDIQYTSLKSTINQQVYHLYSHALYNRQANFVQGQKNLLQKSVREIKTQEEEDRMMMSSKQPISMTCKIDDDVFSVLDLDYGKPELDQSLLIDTSQIILEDMEFSKSHIKTSTPIARTSPKNRLIDKHVYSKSTRSFEKILNKNPITGKHLPTIDIFQKHRSLFDRISNTHLTNRSIRQILNDHVINQLEQLQFNKEMHFARSLLHTKNREFAHRRYRPPNHIELKSKAIRQLENSKKGAYIFTEMPVQQQLSPHKETVQKLQGKDLLTDILFLNKETLGILRLNEKHEMKRKRMENRNKQQNKQKERIKESQQMEAEILSKDKVDSSSTRIQYTSERSKTKLKKQMGKLVQKNSTPIHRMEAVQISDNTLSPMDGKISAFDAQSIRLKQEEQFLAKKKVEEKKMEKNLEFSKQTFNYFISQNEAKHARIEQEIQRITLRKKKKTRNGARLGQSLSNRKLMTEIKK